MALAYAEVEPKCLMSLNKNPLTPQQTIGQHLRVSCLEAKYAALKCSSHTALCLQLAAIVNKREYNSDGNHGQSHES